VAMPTPNPAASSANVSPLRRYASTSRACRPGVQLAPGRPDPPAVTPDNPGGVAEG
jgi:hypothetical protein